MGKRIVFKPDSAGIRRMLQSSDMEKLVETEAKKRAEDPQEVRTFIGFDRAHAVYGGQEK